MEKNMKHYNIEQDMRYLQLLSQSFPTIAEASTEIINLQAILNLPKGTEHFLADIHGEYEAFLHVLKNASGNIKRKVNELFGNTLREQEKRELCSLIYYPEQKLELVKQNEPDINDWYHITLHQLVAVCRDVSSKYTRSKVRKSLPCDFSYIIQELLHEHTEDHDKTAYVNVIVDTIISTGRADDFIIAIATSSSAWLSTSSIFWAISTIEVQEPTSSWTRCAATTVGTSSGVITMYYGWEQLPAMMPASVM